MATFLLYESASGYALFEAKDMDWIGDTPQAVAETVKCVFKCAIFYRLLFHPILIGRRGGKLGRQNFLARARANSVSLFFLCVSSRMFY